MKVKIRPESLETLWKHAEKDLKGDSVLYKGKLDLYQAISRILAGHLGMKMDACTTTVKGSVLEAEVAFGDESYEAPDLDPKQPDALRYIVKLPAPVPTKFYYAKGDFNVVCLILKESYIEIIGGEG